MGFRVVLFAVCVAVEIRLNAPSSHDTGYFKAGETSSTTAQSALNSQDSSGTSSQTDTTTTTSTSSQMDTGISSQTDTSTSSQMDTDFMEDDDFFVCSADEYENSPDHILFEVSVQYPGRDLAISARRVQFEVAPCTPSSLKATACNMFKTLLSAQIPTTLTNLMPPSTRHLGCSDYSINVISI
eukprot:gene22496-29622_t